MKRTTMTCIIALAAVIVCAPTSCKKNAQAAAAQEAAFAEEDARAAQEIAALHARLLEAEAALETAKSSGNVPAEEIKKLEAAVAQVAEQETQAEERRERRSGGRRRAAETEAGDTPGSTPPPDAPPASQPAQSAVIIPAGTTVIGQNAFGYNIEEGENGI